ncbi:solute carrier family 35, member E4, isoform CRA_a, partial [Mus musculus]
KHRVSLGRGEERRPPLVREVPRAYEAWVDTSQSGILAATTFFPDQNYRLAQSLAPEVLPSPVRGIRTRLSDSLESLPPAPAPLVRMCRCPLEHHEGMMTSAEAVAVAGSAQEHGRPKWPPDKPQVLGQPAPARVVVAALVWLLAGASMSSLNKWIFTVHGFGRPLLLSALHMLAAALACHWGAQRPVPHSIHRRVLLLSLTFGTSMACGNVGLSTVPLDLAQLATTTTPLFTMALSALLLGRRHHPLQFAAMGPLCLGAACSLAGELRAPPAGCGFLLVATCLRGFKSVQQ